MSTKKKRNNKIASNDSGRSMVEIVGVLAVMGLITAGAFVLITSSMASQKRNRAADDFANIVQNIRGLFAEADNVSNLPTSVSEGTSLLNALHISSKTPFGGNTTYSVVKGTEEHNGGSYTFQADDYFIIKLTGLDDEDCWALVARSWGQAFDESCEGNVLSIYYSK